MIRTEAPHGTPNPYQPSLAPALPGRSDRVAFLATVAVPLVLFLAAGGVLRISALSPAGLLSGDAYNTTFTFHGVAGWTAPATIPLAAAAVLRGRCSVGALAWVALTALAAALLALVAGQSLLLFGALAGVTYATAGASLLRSARPGGVWAFVSWGLRGSGLALLLTGLSQIFGGPFTGAWMTRALVAPALILAAEGAARKPTSETALAAYLVALTVPAFWSGAPAFAAAVQGITALVLAVLAWRAVRGAPAWSRRLVRLAALTFVQAAWLRGFLSLLSTDMHLHDTYFVLGAFHLELLTPLVALLSLSPPRPGRTAAFAPFALGLGVHVMGWAFLVLGARGMPRRYRSYLPQFQPLHVLATAGALVLLAALGWMIAELVRAARTPSLEEG